MQLCNSAWGLQKAALSPTGSTGVRELTRGLATLPQRWIQEPLVVETGVEDPKENPSDDTFMRWGDYLHNAQVEERVCVYYYFVLFVFVAVCPPGPTQYIYSYAYGTM